MSMNKQSGVQTPLIFNILVLTIESMATHVHKQPQAVRFRSSCCMDLRLKYIFLSLTTVASDALGVGKPLRPTDKIYKTTSTLMRLANQLREFTKVCLGTTFDS